MGSWHRYAQITPAPQYVISKLSMSKNWIADKNIAFSSESPLGKAMLYLSAIVKHSLKRPLYSFWRTAPDTAYPDLSKISISIVLAGAKQQPQALPKSVWQLQAHFFNVQSLLASSLFSPL